MASEALFWLQDVGEYFRSLARQALTQSLRGGVDHTELRHGQPAMRPVELLHPPKMRLCVDQLIVETPSTKTLRLVRVDGPVPPFRPGQYLDLRVRIDGVQTSRPYSISSRPGVGFMDITVREKPGGFVSPHLLHAVRVGDELESSGPAGRFHHEPLIDGRRLVFLAGGSGVTPFMSIIRHVAAHEQDLEIALLYGSRHPDDVIFERELEALSRDTGRLRYLPVISEPPPGYRGQTGLLDAARIRAAIGEVAGKTFYLCGPHAMVELTSAALRELGVPHHRVRHELHGPMADISRHPRWPTGLSPDSVFDVRIDGRETIQARAGAPLLDSLERQGVRVPCSCRSGECSACRIRLLRGSALVTEETRLRESDRERGYVHCCTVYPLGDLEIRI
jgi:ferredoxin-NADP reductase